MANWTWKDKRVFITGASSGIGWATAEHLAGLGARLGLIARREELLAELAGKIRAAGGMAEYAAADVAARLTGVARNRLYRGSL